MITSAYLIACLSAAIPIIIRVVAARLHKAGKALFAAMKKSREREAMRVIARHRDLIDANAVIIFESDRASPEAGTEDAADRRDDLLAFGQAIPFQAAAQPHAPRLGGRALRATWRGTWRGAQ
jgi:hypothetical protein